MRVICAGYCKPGGKKVPCGVLIREVEAEGTGDSHGICDKCFAKQFPMHCFVCGGQLKYEKTESNLRRTFSFLACAKCRITWIRERHHEHNMDLYYQDPVESKEKHE